MSGRSFDERLLDGFGWFLLGWVIRIVVVAFLVATIVKVWI